MSYNLMITRHAAKDLEEIRKNQSLLKRAKLLLGVIKENPFNPYPPYEKLSGDLSGLYFRRLNVKHRIVYQVREEEKVIVILKMKTHYE